MTQTVPRKYIYFYRVVDGVIDGVIDGDIDGVTDGVVDGVIDGFIDGAIDGVMDGVIDGVIDGVRGTRRARLGEPGSAIHNHWPSRYQVRTPLSRA